MVLKWVLLVPPMSPMVPSTTVPPLFGTDAQSVIAVVQDLDVHSEQVSVVSGGLEGVIVPPTNDVSRAVALFHIVGVDLGILIVGDVGQDAA